MATLDLLARTDGWVGVTGFLREWLQLALLLAFGYVVTGFALGAVLFHVFLNERPLILASATTCLGVVLLGLWGWYADRDPVIFGFVALHSLTVGAATYATTKRANRIKVETP